MENQEFRASLRAEIEKLGLESGKLMPIIENSSAYLNAVNEIINLRPSQSI